MKTNELMIGDWVKVKEYDYYHKVVSISYNSICVECDHEIIDINIDRFEPIPLTKEIMLSNGWNFVRGNVYGRKFDEEINGKKYNSPVPFRVFISDAYCYEKMFPTINEDILCAFLYVHELQHALRLCGLTELADNFKI